MPTAPARPMPKAAVGMEAPAAEEDEPEAEESEPEPEPEPEPPVEPAPEEPVPLALSEAVREPVEMTDELRPPPIPVALPAAVPLGLSRVPVPRAVGAAVMGVEMLLATKEEAAALTDEEPAASVGAR